MEKAGLVVGLSSVLVAILALVLGTGHGHGSSSEPSSPADLQLVEMAVRDRGAGPHPRIHLEITLHNTGGQMVIVDRATLRINHVYDVPRCASQGDIPLAHTYGLVLPADAQPGDRASTVLHQQVGPDEADRFNLALGLEAPHDRSTGTIYLFQGELALRTDGSPRQLSLGQVLLSAPIFPTSGEYYWNSETPALVRDLITTSPDYVRELRQLSMPCWRANTTTLRRALRGKGVRSASLEEIAGELVPPSLATLE